MARISIDSSDVISAINERTAFFAQLMAVDGLDSLFCAKSVDPWHGHAVDIPDDISLQDLGRLCFPRAEDMQYSPVYAINPDAVANAQNINLYGLMSHVGAHDFLSVLMQELKDKGILLEAPSPDNKQNNRRQRSGLVSGSCPEYRAVIQKGNPESFVPNLQNTQMLGIVGGAHTTVTAEQMLEFLEQLRIAYGAEKVQPLSAGTLDKGGLQFISAKLDGFGFKPPTLMDKNVGILSLVQGMAGQLALTKSLSNTIIVCRNTCTHAVNEKGAKRFKHTKNVHSRMTDHARSEAELFLDNALAANEELSQWAERAVNHRLTSEQINNSIGVYLFGEKRWNEQDKNPLAADQMNRLDAYNVAHNYSPGQKLRGANGNGDGTLWSLYNTLTFMDSNVSPTYSNSRYRLTTEDVGSLQYVQNLVQF